MKVYNQEKTKELNRGERDFTLGYLRADKLFIAHHEAVEGKKAVYQDREVIEESGGISIYKDLVEPAVEPKEEWDEYEDIQVFIPYTEKELAEREILVLKKKLSDTDYQAIKYAEGELTDAEYAEMKARRSAWRARINALEEVIR